MEVDDIIDVVNIESPEKEVDDIIDVVNIESAEQEKNNNKTGSLCGNDENQNLTDGQPFIDRLGNKWNYLGTGAFVERHYPLLGLKMCTETKRWAVLFCSQRFDLKCPYQMLLVKNKGLIYQRFEHSHQVTKTPEQLLKGKTPSPKKDGEDGRLSHEMELSGWKLVAEGVYDEEKLQENLTQHFAVKYRPHDELIWYFKCRYTRCSYKIRWFKRLGEIWSLGLHSKLHGGGGICKRKRRRLRL
ncbi:unnamed protein product [Meloidogyne enterolobii]|uniref:Uncharacterized protein n=1 Tax=Meloidogyne enterolobii TaxID=390850 RepID=A0ACB1A8L7_MELEN